MGGELRAIKRYDDLAQTAHPAAERPQRELADVRHRQEDHKALQLGAQRGYRLQHVLRRGKQRERRETRGRREAREQVAAEGDGVLCAR